MVAQVLHLRGRGKRILRSSWPDWLIYQTPGQPSIHKETLYNREEGERTLQENTPDDKCRYKINKPFYIKSSRYLFVLSSIFLVLNIHLLNQFISVTSKQRFNYSHVFFNSINHILSSPQYITEVFTMY